MKDIDTTGIDFNSPTWRRILAIANQRIEELHFEIEQPLDHDDTQFARGEIRAFRQIAELPEARAPITAAQTPGYFEEDDNGA